MTGGLFRKVPLGIPLAGLSALPILVWFALLPVGIAIPLAAAFGALMCLTLVARTPAAAQRYRQVRASGEDAWVATEQALGVVMAPKAARILLYEPRVWICLSRWLVNAHPAGTDRYFAYHRGRRKALWLIVALMAVQTLLTHLVLVMIFGDPLWVWIVCGVDAYAVIWILGFYASMVVIPHRVNRNDLRLRYGFLKEIVVPRAAILRVRPVRYAERKPGKLLVDGTGEAMFTSGEATAAIQLDPDVALRFRCRPVPERINTLYVTADAQDEFVAAVAGDLRPTENAN